MPVDVFSLILKLQGYALNKAEHQLEQIHAISKPDFAQWQKEKVWQIVKHHYNNNPFYKELLGGGLPATWEELPILAKKDYQHPLPELITTGYSKKELYQSNTSGSSGHPFFFVKDKPAHALTWALVRQRYKSCGIQPGDLEARFYGIPLSGKAAKVEQLKDKLMNRVRFPVFDLSDAAYEVFLQRFRKHSVKYVYGYTNAIRHFAGYLVDNNIVLKDVCPTIKVVIVTSEMCTKADKDVIEKAFGIPVVIEYGASEVGIIGIDDIEGRMRMSEELLYLETNEKGELLITSLFNKAFPFIRYNIGDVVSIAEDAKGKYISSIGGRSDDTVLLPGGKQAAGLTLYYCSRDIMERSGKIKEMYITQTALDHFKLFYIAEEELVADDKAIVQKAFDKYLQPGLQLEFIRTDKIRRKKNGKFQLFNSEII